MDKLRFRCPHCHKLYEVQSSLIESAKPLFDCLACETRFTFDYPPTLDPIATRIVLKKSTAASSEDQKNRAASRDCPKCGAINPRAAQECYSCHVIFEKLEGLPQDKTLRAQPSLVRKWRDLMNDFENLQLHEDFILSCHQYDAHRFALLKYGELKEAQGGDSLCDIMISRVQAMMNVNLKKQAEEQSQQYSFLTPKMKKYLEWSPFAISAFMILLGNFHMGYRNLIGLGVALAFMAAGIRVFTKGRII